MYLNKISFFKFISITLRILPFILFTSLLALMLHISTYFSTISSFSHECNLYFTLISSFEKSLSAQILAASTEEAASNSDQLFWFLLLFKKVC